MRKLLSLIHIFGVKGYVRLAYCIDTEKVKRSLPALEKLAAAYRK